jgi:hypothetical protein
MPRMARGMAGIKISDVKMEKTADEAGPEMLGCPIRHLVFKMTYSMAESGGPRHGRNWAAKGGGPLLGTNRTEEVFQDEEWWVTDKFKGEWIQAWKRRQEPKRTGNEELDALMSSNMVAITGLPLKMVRTTTEKTGTGRSRALTMTTEITDIKEASIDKEQLVIPSDYKEIDVNEIIKSMGGDKKDTPPPLPVAPAPVAPTAEGAGGK